LATGAFYTPAFAEVVYTRGNSADPESLDPHKTSTVYEAHILRDLFEGLVMQDKDANLIPGAAESWTVWTTPSLNRIAAVTCIVKSAPGGTSVRSSANPPPGSATRRGSISRKAWSSAPASSRPSIVPITEIGWRRPDSS